ncbi:acyl-CoA thioesterase [Chitinophaga lutea]
MLNKEPLSLHAIRFNDCDPFGHLNNASYLNYFMNAREDQLAEHYNISLQTFAEKKRGWVVTQHRIAYLKPALVGEKVWIGSRLLDFGTDGIQLEMWMSDEAKKKLKAFLWTTFAHVDLTTGRRTAHDEEFIRLLGDLRVEGAGTFEERVAATVQSFAR